MSPNSLSQILFLTLPSIGERVWDDIEAHGWLPDVAQEEHPVRALAGSIWSATAKLASALSGRELAHIRSSMLAKIAEIREVLSEDEGDFNDVPC